MKKNNRIQLSETSLMTKKNNRPTLDEYFGLEAEAYGTSQWMARNQIQTTGKALELLQSEPLGGFFTGLDATSDTWTVLDIGCGTGYSSHVILDSGARVIGLDFSKDMLTQCPRDPELHLIHGDMRALPFRSTIVNHIISISALNFSTEGAKSREQMRSHFQAVLSHISQCLRPEGRVAVEFYPTPLEESLFHEVLRSLPFQGGFLILDPKSKREKKFLLLRLTH